MVGVCPACARFKSSRLSGGGGWAGLALPPAFGLGRPEELLVHQKIFSGASPAPSPIGRQGGQRLTYHGRRGQHSIRINDQYRVCFVWKDGDAHQVEVVDYH
jgi:RelE-like toxin of type II toxin-antitoxin system HigB